MKNIILYLLFFLFCVSCTVDNQKDNNSTENKDFKRILIGKVKSETKDATFYHIDNPREVFKCFEIFKDTFDNWSNFGFRDYDYRLQLYVGEEVVQNIYINESNSGHSFRGTKNMTSGIVRNDLWDTLANYMKPLESESFIFQNEKVAEEFYQLVKSKGAFVTTPYFCNWRKYQGELLLKTDVKGYSVSLDNLEHIINASFPDYEFDIQSIDFGSGNYHHPKMVKIFSSRDFFENFEFRGRNFIEKIDSTYYLNVNDFVYDKSDYYTEFNLLTPDFINYDSIQIVESKDKITIDFEDLWQENYRIYNPIVEVVASPETMSDLYDWIKENNDNKK